MSQSVLLTIARASIEEVLQAENSINRTELLTLYPLLSQPLECEIILYLDNKVRGRSRSLRVDTSLLEEIIHNAKIAAFQDENFDPLVTSEYLHTTIKLTLFTSDGELTHQSEAILKG
ncbi:AMMECR1 domain-containing protein [Sulfuricurvum sp.]|uniref:AMMECR1 domain-containing protein n=1 Tax=Sulfuricurvum sp. TaxID=2025608 RepID=UPI003BB733BF